MKHRFTYDETMGLLILITFCLSVLFIGTAIGFFFGAGYGLSFMGLVTIVLFIVLLVSYSKDRRDRD